jgi:hypothetical protein
MSEQSSLSSSATGPSQHGGARTTLASLAAIGSVAGRIELLPADFAAYDGSGRCRQFDLLLGCQALSTGGLDSVYRLRVLPSVASEKMPAWDKRDRFRSIVGVRSFCCHLNLLSSNNGECGGRAAGTVIS